MSPFVVIPPTGTPDLLLGIVMTGFKQARHMPCSTALICVSPVCRASTRPCHSPDPSAPAPATQDLLLNIMVSTETMYGTLATQVADYSRTSLSSDVLSTMWSTFFTHENLTSAFVISSAGLVCGYRRDGPETPLLGGRLGVAIPSPEDDPWSILYGFAPDNSTGMPVLSGPMVKICALGSCPSEMNRSVYLPPTVPPLSSPAWLLGRDLPRGKIVLMVTMGDVQEPILSVVASMKNSQGVTAAVLTMAFSASRLQQFLQSVSPVQLYKGRMFITTGHGLNILSASNGSLFTPPATPGGAPTFVSALCSSDEVVRAAAYYLNATFGDELFSWPTTTVAHLGHAGKHYINSMPLLYEDLQLLVILAVPQQEFHGPIDESRQQGLIFTMAIVVVMFVVGGMAICLSTTGVSKKLRTQEKDLDEAAAANKALTEQLRMMSRHTAVPWPKVDMGTPLEKLTSILKALQPGHVLSAEHLQQMQALITADDLHAPQFLTALHSAPKNGPTRFMTAVVDSETDSWIEIIATGRRSPRWRLSFEGLPSRRRRSNASQGSPRYIRQASEASPSPLAHATNPVALPGSLQEHWPSNIRRMSRDLVGEGAGASGKHAATLGAPRSFSAVTAITTTGPASSHASLAAYHGADGAAPGGGMSESSYDGHLFCAQSIHFAAIPAGALDTHVLAVLCTVVDLSIQATQAEPSPASSIEYAGSSLAGTPTSAREYARLRSAENSPRGAPSPRGGFPPLPEGAYPTGSAKAIESLVINGTMMAPPPPPMAVLHETRLLADASSRGEDKPKALSTVLLPPPPVVLNELQKAQAAALRGLGEWEFDTLALAEVTGVHTVPLVGYSLFVRMGLVHKFGLSPHKLMSFLYHIGRGMEAHPYHNAAHISDVSASLLHVLSHSGVGDHLRSIDKLAALVAALIHDYKHPGVNNDFLNRTRDELATIYNDHSPLENYHLAEAFHLLYSNPECNFLEVLAEDDFMELRRNVIEMVLASDLKRHFGVLDQFKARVSQECPWDVEKSSDRLLLMQLSLKICDLGHCAKPLTIHLEWSRRVNEEFYLQGDLERAAQLAVSPFMDRFNNHLPRSQLGFFQFLAMPLYDAWAKSFPRSTHLLSNMTSNIEYWKGQLQQATSVQAV